MTPEQIQQIEGVRRAVSRLREMRDMGRPEWLLAELRREGWPEAAIQHVLTEGGEE